jgi:hypothetical protein
MTTDPDATTRIFVQFNKGGMMKKHSVPSWVVLATGLLAAAVAAAFPCVAAQPETAPSKAEPAGEARPAATVAAEAPAGASAAGMLAFRDPVTGKLRPPTEAELEAIRPQLEALFNQSSEGLEEIVLDDGSVGVDLQGRFQTAVVAVVNEDGTVAATCVSSQKEIDDLLKLSRPDSPPANPAEPHATAVK